MLKDTSLCMGCMCDKTYDGPCKLCGYSDDMPCIPSYLKPKTFLNERYLIGKVLSYNGEGAVYVAYDTATGTKVTVKEFMPDTLCSRKKGEEEIVVNPEMLPLYKTYLSEFIDLNKTLMKSRGMAHLQMVLDVFSENNTAYAVLEFINGIPLNTYLANSSGELMWEQIKELFPPIFTTLSLVHAAGLIHQGISLSTIYVTDKLELKLTGFSITAARTTNTEIACEIFAGYAAPEQYTANEVNGTWTDVYGIAAVLYRCLTGCTPTEAIARTGSSMLEPMMINRNVPSNVSKVIMRGLNLSNEGRIQTITEFVDKLFEQPKYVGIKRGEDGKPLTKQQAKKLKKQKKERAKTIAVLVMAGLVLITFAVIFAMTLDRRNDPENSSGGSDIATQEASGTPPVTETTTPSPETTQSVPQTVEPIVPDANISLPDFTDRKYESTVSRYEGTFTFIPTYEYTDEYAAGAMYDQSIEPETMVAPGTQIEVKVSKGPSLVKLPDYTDMRVDKYIAELGKLNIKYSVRQEKTNDVPSGEIVKCSKEIGDLVNVQEGETITVYVAAPIPEDELPETEQGGGSVNPPEETAEGGGAVSPPSEPAEGGGIPVE